MRGAENPQFIYNKTVINQCFYKCTNIDLRGEVIALICTHLITFAFCTRAALYRFALQVNLSGRSTDAI